MSGLVALSPARHTCTPREVVRAGELWRLVQEASVRDMDERGWSPSRLRALGSAFVVRALHGVHHAELGWGEPVIAHTWVATPGRSVVFDRRTNLDSPRGPAFSARVGWAHLRDGRPAKAPPEILAALGGAEGSPLPAPPPDAPDRGEILHTYRVNAAHSDADPLGHTNHCRFVDWADDAVAAWVSSRGGDPFLTVARAESLRFVGSAPPGLAVTVVLRRLSVVGTSTRFGVCFYDPQERLLADGVLVRELG